MLLFSVFDELTGEPHHDVRSVVEFGWGCGHPLATGGALCRNWLKVEIVADGKLWNHVGSLGYLWGWIMTRDETAAGIDRFVDTVLAVVAVRAIFDEFDEHAYIGSAASEGDFLTESVTDHFRVLDHAAPLSSPREQGRSVLCGASCFWACCLARA